MYILIIYTYIYIYISKTAGATIRHRACLVLSSGILDAAAHPNRNVTGIPQSGKQRSQYPLAFGTGSNCHLRRCEICYIRALSSRLIGFRHNRMHETMSPSQESSVPSKRDRNNETERREFDDVNGQ